MPTVDAYEHGRFRRIDLRRRQYERGRTVWAISRPDGTFRAME